MNFNYFLSPFCVLQPESPFCGHRRAGNGVEDRILNPIPRSRIRFPDLPEFGFLRETGLEWSMGNPVHPVHEFSVNRLICCFGAVRLLGVFSRILDFRIFLNSIL